MEKEKFICSYCGEISNVTLDSKTLKKSEIKFKDFPEVGCSDFLLETMVMFCQNDNCNQYTIKSLLSSITVVSGYKYGYDEGCRKDLIKEWQLKPIYSGVKLPDYIPSSLRDDYNQAYLIKDLSPKASATLSRRCLQSMIKDYWKITKNNLNQQIQAIENKVSASSWKAIDAVRHIGNIGAHMNREKGTDEILDVEPQEAEELLKLIELLFKDWYIAGHERAEIEARTIESATKKGWKEKKDNENKN